MAGSRFFPRRGGVVFWAALTVVLASCGGGDDGTGMGFQGSCGHPRYCDDYFGFAARTIESERARCPSVDVGRWSVLPCSRAGVLGGCRYQSDGVAGFRAQWYAAGWGTEESAKETCARFGGTFLGPNAIVQ